MAALAARLAWRPQQQQAFFTSAASTPSRFSLPASRSLGRPQSRRPLQQHQHQFQRRHESSGGGPHEHARDSGTGSKSSSGKTGTAGGGSTESNAGAGAAAAQAVKEARRRATAERIANSSLRFMPSFIGRRLRGPLENMIKSPGSHVVSFLVIHEITAILPLLGFMSLFVYMDWVPTAWVAGPWAGWALEGVRKYAGYFRKKGWFGMGGAGKAEGERKLEGELEEEVQQQQRHQRARDSASGSGDAETAAAKKGGGWFSFSSSKTTGKEEEAATTTSAVDAHEDAKAKDKSAASKVATTTWHAVKKVVTFDNIDTGYKTSIQFAAAYAITKVLLPARLALSVWLTPSGARAFSRVWRFVRGGAAASK
ncbi:FLILHELTA motif-containing protein Pfam [Microdochium nivale]|nr:FLILHELTA motif-containing protein Pfam [Microdochium nivale]